MKPTFLNENEIAEYILQLTNSPTTINVAVFSSTFKNTRRISKRIYSFLLSYYHDADSIIEANSTKIKIRDMSIYFLPISESVSEKIRGRYIDEFIIVRDSCIPQHFLNDFICQQ